MSLASGSGAAGILVACLVVHLACTAETRPEGKPPLARNVAVLCIDTLRADHLSSYGYSRPTSPRIDQLIERGVRFADAYAHSNWTVPATASLLTSTLPSEHGAGLEGELRLLDDRAPNQMHEEIESLAEVLSSASLATGLFSGNPFLYGRFKDGFDVAEVGRQGATELTDMAIDWLRGAVRSRFFLYIQYMDLHQPLDPPEPYLSQFDVSGAGEVDEGLRNWSYRKLQNRGDPGFKLYRERRVAIYDGALRFIDSEIARLLSVLAELGVAENTLIVVTSDHGEEFWDHAEIEREMGGDPRGIWGVGHGHSMFQELVRVPLAFHGPGVQPSVSDCRVRHVDVAPTVLDMLGLPPSQRFRGQSLAPIARALSDSCPRGPAIAESPSYGPDAQAIIWNEHKLIRRADGQTLLFDLVADSQERNDLSVTDPETCAALQDLLDRAIAAYPRGPGEARDYDRETREQLQSLGYLQ